MSLLLLLACAEPEDSGVDLGEPPAELLLPDTDGLDFAAAAEAGLQLSKEIGVSSVWAAHAELLSRRSVGCPDLWVGAPDDESVDLDEEGGTSWFDHCGTGATEFDGWVWVDASVLTSGDPTSAEGALTEGSRALVADGVIGDGDGILLEVDGEFSDSTSRTDAADYQRWTWSSTARGTVTGSAALGAGRAPGGWRADMQLYATGGDVDLYEVNGNAFLFEDRLAERFDSVEIDLSFAGEGAADPEACALEPAGWIGLRDENAYWYDIAFQPRHGGGDAECDGCGELYVRGVDTSLGPVCMDFDFIWQEAPITPPVAADYVFSLHTLEAP